MITGGRQLPVPLTKGQQNEVGHWVPNSSMPNTNDALASSSEMQAKKRVVEYFQNGRELVGPGEFQRGDKMQSELDVAVQPWSSQVKRLASELEEDLRFCGVTNAPSSPGGM